MKIIHFCCIMCIMALPMVVFAAQVECCCDQIKDSKSPYVNVCEVGKRAGVCRKKCKASYTSVILDNDPDADPICCKGAKDHKGTVRKECCEKASDMAWVTAIQQGDDGDACCKENSSKNSDGTFRATCCRNADGKVENGKCCKQAPQGG